MHKAIQQHCVVHNQRIKTVMQLTDQLKKSFEELESCHFEQQGNAQGELKKEMSQLQKKILKETVSDMNNVEDATDNKRVINPMVSVSFPGTGLIASPDSLSGGLVRDFSSM